MKTPARKHYFIKKFAELTKVTVRTLHYYDEIGLLKPSERRPNGYRLYTEIDLMRLQQIVTLKFLGFSLEKIKELLSRPGFAVQKSLSIQAAIIDEEVRRLEQASRALREVAKTLENSRKIDWPKVTKIIEVIQMSEETKKTWQERFFTERELKEFEELGKQFTPAKIQAYQENWTALIDEVKQNLKADPTSEIAQYLARRWQALLDEGYGDHPRLKARIGEAYQTGQIPAEYRTFGPEVWDFMAKAMKALKEIKLRKSKAQT
jgi:DNA-binding transcriptional MerR regulator